MKKSIKIFSFLLVMSMLFTSCEFEVSTARINDIKVCGQLSGELCDQDSPVFNPNDPEIVVSCKLNNAPSDTEVTFVWKYVEGDEIIIDQAILNSSDYGTDVDMHSSLSKPNNGWPVGKYQVEILLGNDTPLVKTFKVQ